MSGSRGGDGVLLMTYGSPASLDPAGVRAYLARVRGGREPEDALVAEFVRRYRLIGGSPLIGATQRQATALGEALDGPVEIGMRFSEPSIERGLRTLLERGVERVAGIILSPQYSPLLMDGYERAVTDALSVLDGAAPRVAVAGAWHDEPRFLDALALRVREGLARFGEAERPGVAVLLTAHSLPRRVADREPGYLLQLEATAGAVAARARLPAGSWWFCWQSAGHEPGEWMSPDFADLMPTLAGDGRSGVLVAPIQFLSDHLETLYDVGIGAREQAERHGLRFERTASLDVEPVFINALAAVARRTLERAAA